MKVIAGKYKNRIIYTKTKYISSTNEMRPTLAKIRESFFSIIQKYFDDFSKVSMLDLCAGSGSMGIEALSRNFKNVTFIDSNYQHLALIKETMSKIDQNANFEILCKNIYDLPESNYQFNIVYFDPPYKFENINLILNSLIEKNWLHQNAIIAVEMKKGKKVSLSNVTLKEERIYGNTKLVFYCV